MTSKEKAEELVNKFLPKMYCYVCSGMLTNTYDGDVAKGNAIECAMFCACESLSAVEKYGRDNDELQNMENEFRFWNEVKQELLNMK